MNKPNYKITVIKRDGFWRINLYTLYTKPVYDTFGKTLIRHEQEWHRLQNWGEDAALFYWEARLRAWNLKRKLDNGTFYRGEETIYERKG